MDTALQRFIDRQDIADALHKYVTGLDSLDRDLLLSVGHPAGKVDFDGLFAGVWPDFVDWLITAHQPLLYHNHRITDLIADIEGDSARSTANVTATLLVPRPSGDVEGRYIQSRYFDVWTRESGRWVTAERRLVRGLRRVTQLSSVEFKERYKIKKPTKGDK